MANGWKLIKNMFSSRAKQNDTETTKPIKTNMSITINGYKLICETEDVRYFILNNYSDYNQLFQILPRINETLYMYASSDGEYCRQKPEESGSYPDKDHLGEYLLESNIKDPGEIIHEFGHAVDFSLYDPPHMGPYSFQPMFGRLQGPFKSEIYEQRRKENHHLYDLDYSANHEEIFARIFREYFKGKVPPLFDQFNPSWFDKAITNVYEQRRVGCVYHRCY